MAKKKKWLRFRHRVVTTLAQGVLGVYLHFKLAIKIEKFKEQGKRQYLILYNHQTGYDQFIVGLGFKGPIYYVASEDLFSNGFVSKLLKWAVAPIPIKKQATDARAVLDCLRVKKEGGTIAIAPEGNRTYSGRTEYINPALAGLVRSMKLPIVFYRIEGGYGAQPRWSDVVRKGPIKSFVSRVMEYDEYASLSNDELLAVIKKELWQNECETDGVYTHKNNEVAQYIERAYYVCPHCGLSVFRSNKDEVRCERCGMTARYTPEKTFVCVQGDFPFKTTAEWYDYQTNFINALDPSALTEQPLYTEKAAMFEVALCKNKKPLCENAELCLYGDKITVTAGEHSAKWQFNEVRAVTVLGRNKLNVYIGDKIIQFKGDKRFNAVKYVQLFHHYKNVEKGENHGEFLGL